LRRQLTLDNYLEPVLAFPEAGGQAVDCDRVFVIFLALSRGDTVLAESIQAIKRFNIRGFRMALKAFHPQIFVFLAPLLLASIPDAHALPVFTSDKPMLPIATG
jgi:hypothetical protein